MRGKVISLLGAPACGKTTLALKLAEHYPGIALLEEPENGFPKEIGESLTTRKYFFEKFVWFRNRLIENYTKGIEIAYKGKVAVLDAEPFYQNAFYAGLSDLDQFQKDLIYHLSEMDKAILPQPDCTVYIETNQEIMGKSLEKRRGQWAWEENEEWRKFLLQMPLHCAAFMEKIQHKVPNLVKLKREEFDLDIPGDLERIIGKVDEVLKSKIY